MVSLKQEDWANAPTWRLTRKLPLSFLLPHVDPKGIKAFMKAYTGGRRWTPQAKRLAKDNFGAELHPQLFKVAIARKRTEEELIYSLWVHTSNGGKFASITKEIRTRTGHLIVANNHFALTMSADHYEDDEMHAWVRAWVSKVDEKQVAVFKVMCRMSDIPKVGVNVS